MELTFMLYLLSMNAILTAASVIPRNQTQDPLSVEVTFRQPDGTPWVQDILTDGTHYLVRKCCPILTDCIETR